MVNVAVYHLRHGLGTRLLADHLDATGQVGLDGSGPFLGSGLGPEGLARFGIALHADTDPPGYLAVCFGAFGDLCHYFLLLYLNGPRMAHGFSFRNSASV